MYGDGGGAILESCEKDKLETRNVLSLDLQLLSLLSKF